MALIVQKYGGTSVGSIDRIKNVAANLLKTQKVGNDVVAVVSAMSGTTDHLIELAKEITDTPSQREMDMMVSTGEQVSIALLAMAIHAQGGKAVSFNANQVGIHTTSDHSRAKILNIKTGTVRQAISEGNIVVIAGFQGVDENQNITTLGRGGSDTTAVAVAAALQANRCDIFTDVNGVYTADPRVVKNARKLDEITHDEMLELASMGAKVLHDRSVIFAMKYNVPLRVLSSFEPDGKGTLIVKEKKMMEGLVITGISKKTDETRVDISSVPDKPGIAAYIFKRLAEQKIFVNMIVQSMGKDGKSQISFTILDQDVSQAKQIMESIQQEVGGGNITFDQNVAIVSVVGIGMKAHSGVAAKVFDVLAENKINIEMISTSEIKISVVIKKEFAEKTVQLLHKNFFEEA